MFRLHFFKNSHISVSTYTPIWWFDSPLMERQGLCPSPWLWVGFVTTKPSRSSTMVLARLGCKRWQSIQLLSWDVPVGIQPRCCTKTHSSSIREMAWTGPVWFSSQQPVLHKQLIILWLIRKRRDRKCGQNKNMWLGRRGTFSKNETIWICFSSKIEKFLQFR